LNNLDDNVDEITYLDYASEAPQDIYATTQHIATNPNGNMFASWGTGMQPADNQGYKSPSEKRNAWESKNKTEIMTNNNFD
jgi:hypothetical protein